MACQDNVMSYRDKSMLIKIMSMSEIRHHANHYIVSLFMVDIYNLLNLLRNVYEISFVKKKTYTKVGKFV